MGYCRWVQEDEKACQGMDLYGLKPIIIAGLADSPKTTEAFMMSCSESFCIYRQEMLCVFCAWSLIDMTGTESSSLKHTKQT